MVQSLKIITAAAFMGAASAFTPTTPASFGIQSRPFSPSSSMQLSASPVLDAPTTSGNSIILDRPATIEEQQTDQDKRSSRTDGEMDPNGDWILRIYNDNINTREYVAVCLVQVVGLCESRAYFTMQDAHHNGLAKVGEYNQEVAECYEEQLNDRGVMCDVVMANGE